MPTFYRLKEGRRLDITPSTEVTGGDLVIVGPRLCGVAPSTIAANKLGTIELDGLFSAPKATGSGTDLAAGVEVFWDASEGVVTADDDEGANASIGTTAAAASTSASRVPILLNHR